MLQKSYRNFGRHEIRKGKPQFFFFLVLLGLKPPRLSVQYEGNKLQNKNPKK